MGGVFGTRQYRCDQSKTGDSGRTNDNRNNLAKFNSSFWVESHVVLSLSYSFRFTIFYLFAKRITRSSCPKVFCKKVFLEISLNSQENTYARVSFLIKLPMQVYLKRDPGTGVFLWILWNFQEYLCLQNTSDGCFWIMNFP